MTKIQNIIAIPALKDNYIWAIVDDTSHSVIIVDPGDATPVIDFLKQKHLSLAAILITHHHWDHTNGVAELVNHFNVPVYGASKKNIPQVTNEVHDGDQISIGDLHFQVLAIPGHTLDHVAYYAPDILFCGDTLFSSGCGRIFEGTPEQMYQTLQKLAALPADTKIYCGHEYTLNNLRFAQVIEPRNVEVDRRLQQIKLLRDNNLPSLPSLLSNEKKTNPFLRCDSPEVKTSVEKYAEQLLDNPVSIFTYLRKWKDQF